VSGLVRGGRVAIVSVGDEVTSGETVDSNAAWLAARLREIGADVDWHLAVGDDHVRIVDGLRWLLDRCDAIVVGGGIGPTHDDRTRAAVADVAGAELERHEELVATIRDRFAGFGVDMPDSNLRQAEIPGGATAFPPVGTAAGFRVDVTRADGRPCWIYVLPGVPFELREMTEREVLPDLVARLGRRSVISRTVRVTGAGESRIGELIGPVLERYEEDESISIASLSSTGEVRVRVTANGDTPEDANKQAGIVIHQIVELLGDAVAGLDDESVEENIARLLRLAGATVATAESCTAGLVSSRLSTVSGATDYLRGGIVTYATEAKSTVLGVDPAIVDEHGPCSRPTAEAMAQRAREVFGADLGLAVVCVAGPSPQSGKEVGTSIWALATPDDVRSWSRLVPGDRAVITERASAAAVDALRRHLLDLLGDEAPRT
jgi:nicotinamide-nucleotide amidase